MLTRVGAADVVPGIAYYEVILPAFTVGPDGSPGSLAGEPSLQVKNMFGDINDRGVAVGRVNLASIGMRGFAWSPSAQFGLAPATVTWLPMPVDDAGLPFLATEAFDLSEAGEVVGGVGSVAGLQPPGGSGSASDWSQRGVIWRLGAGAGGVASWQRIDPPAVQPHGVWPQGGLGYSLLEAVAAEPPLRAVGYAGSVWPCSGPTSSRPAALLVEFEGASQTPVFWTDPDSRSTAGAAAPKARILGVSRDGAFLVGAQNGAVGCDTEAVQGSPCAPTRWWRDPILDPLALARTALGASIPLGLIETAEVRAVSATPSDGGAAIGVGYVWPFSAQVPLPLKRPHAWRIPAEPASGAGAPQSEPLHLPLAALEGAVAAGGVVDDIEVARWRGACASARVAVGASFDELSARSATVWFWSGPLWQPGAWSAVDVNTTGVLSPGWQATPDDHIEHLRGVNQYGDCVGTAVVAGIRRPVILKAVLSSPMGADLDCNGCVGAADLAILLNAWCSPAPCGLPSPAADLNHDWAVDAQDLAILLNGWGCQAGAASPLVPEEIAEASKLAVEFAALFVGLGDIEGYRSWAATAPEPLRAIVDEVMWEVARGVE